MEIPENFYIPGSSYQWITQHQGLSDTLLKAFFPPKFNTISPKAGDEGRDWSQADLGLNSNPLLLSKCPWRGHVTF